MERPLGPGVRKKGRNTYQVSVENYKKDKEKLPNFYSVNPWFRSSFMRLTLQRFQGAFFLRASQASRHHRLKHNLLYVHN